jgi:EpsI family protein
LTASVEQTTPPRPWTSERWLSKTTIAQLVLLAGLFFAVYASTLASLARSWWGHEQLHGFLVPLISLYLVWVRRDELRSLPATPATGPSLPVILLGGILFVLGQVGSVTTLNQISLPVMIVGLVLLLGGTAQLRVLGFPIAYLVFMLPILEDVVAPLHWPLQLLTAQQGVTLLQMLGIPALVDRQYVVLPHITLEVAILCSGVNYLISIIAIGLPLAYLTLERWWSRVALILLGLAIGWSANWMRVTLIGVWSVWGGEGVHGPFHILHGMFVAWMGYLGLLAGAWGLAKAETRLPNRRRAAETVHTARAPLTGPPASAHAELAAHRAWTRAWCLAVISLVGLWVVPALTDRGPVSLKQDLAAIPFSIDGWVGQDADPQTAVFRIRGADQELVRTYRSPQGGRLQLYVGYLTSQRQEKKIVSHLSAPLHEQADEVTIPVDSGRVIVANRGRLRDRPNQRGILFWYDVNGGVLANRYRAKLATLWDGLRRGRTNGAIILLSGGLLHGDEKEFQREAEAFARALIPILQRHLP